MNKALAGLLISLGFLVPALVSAHGVSNPSKDKTPPALTSIRIASTNTDPSKAKAGDTVTLTFTANEKVTPIVLVETKTLFVKSRNTAGNSWEASYVVSSRDRIGKVDYLITLIDASKNGMVCSSARLPFIKYCPTTDGSSVTIYKNATTTPQDTMAPVIAPHEDVSVTTEGTTAEVSYSLPAATDNVDASVSVSCSPASGSVFALGNTTVICLAQDAAGNQATSTFLVVVTQEVAEPEPYVMAAQLDDSYLCGAETTSWRVCDTAGTFSFTDTVGEGTKTIDLGLGSGMGQGTIETVTIAAQMNTFHTWGITISCFEDSAHTVPCSDWASIEDDANESSDAKYWSADFSSLDRTFRQDGHYVMTMYDTDWDTPAYGSESLKEPYYKIIGLQ